MGSAKIRRDDEVVVISGKDRGKTGRVLRVDPARQRVYVEGLNIVKRHQRPQQVPDRPAGRDRGRRDREGRPDPHLQRHARRPQGQEAHARGRRPRGRRAPSRDAAVRDASSTGTSAMATAAPRRPRASRSATWRRSARRSSSASATRRRCRRRASRRSRSTWASATPSRTRRSSTPPPSSSRPSPASSPSVRRARKSIAQFKVREGMPVGVVGDAARRARLRVPRPPACRSRSRGSATSAACRRSRSTAAATTSMGVREQIIFPEIDYDAGRPGARPRRDDHHQRAAPTRRPTPCSRRSACRSAARATRQSDDHPRRPERLMAKTSQRVRQARPAQVQDPRVHALPPLRPRALGLPQVRRVPHLPARARAQRLHPRHDEEQLVAPCR